MRIAVLFDGGGLARLGLEQAGHDCIGYEIDPVKHYLSSFVGSGRVVCLDVTKYSFNQFDAVWASPPCQRRSIAKGSFDNVLSPFGQVDLVPWSLSLPHDLLWVECTMGSSGDNSWGQLWNAAQFTVEPIQNRNRYVGGRYPQPRIFRPYSRRNPGVCPAILASEYKGCGSAGDKRRASRFYGRKLTLDECAYHQGFTIPPAWRKVPPGWRDSAWSRVLYETLGNGVPVYMSEGFGVTAK